MSSLPTPLRAALGLALTVVDNARENATSLPQKAAGLPVAIASQAVQISLRAQQQYAAYIVKGDELIGTFRGTPEEPPAWATFDDPAANATPARNTAFDRVPDAEDELDEDDAVDDLAAIAAELDDDAPSTETGPTNGESDDQLPFRAAPDTTAALDQLEQRRPGADALDLLEGTTEGADAADAASPADTTSRPAAVDQTVGSDGVVEEIIGEDAPRSTAPREPRKSARKAARKTTARKTPSTSAPGTAAARTGRATTAAKTATAPGTAVAGGTKATKAAKATKATKSTTANRPTKTSGSTPRGTSPSMLPPSPDSEVSDTQPPAE